MSESGQAPRKTGAIRLLWIWNAELTANLSRKKIGDFGMSWDCRHPTRIGKTDVFAVFGSFISENAPEPLQVSNELAPLHSHLEFFDHYLVFGKLRQIHWLANHAHGIDKVFPSLL
jgi:hypothetical protein